jgi:hypothetical protein
MVSFIIASWFDVIFVSKQRAKFQCSGYEEAALRCCQFTPINRPMTMKYYYGKEDKN